MTINLKAFVTLDKSFHTTVKMGDGMVRGAHGRGDVKIYSDDKYCIKDVLYLPHSDSNLLSEGQFLRVGYSLVFEDFVLFSIF